MNLCKLSMLLLLSLFAACASDFDADDRQELNPTKSDEIVGSCTPSACFGPAVNGIGWCDDSCAFYGDCANDVATVCGFDECSVSDQGRVIGCGPTEFCTEGLCVDTGTPLPNPVECVVTDEGVVVGCGANEFCTEGTCVDIGTPLPNPVECVVTDEGVVVGCGANEFCTEGTCVDIGTPLPNPVECVVTDEGVSIGCTLNQFCVENHCIDLVP